MKKILTFAFICMLMIACKDEKKAEVKTVSAETIQTTKDPNATYAKAEFSIEGMTCQVGCANTIQKNLTKKEGVAFAKVDFEKKLAMVEYDTKKLSLEDINAAVTEVSDVYTVHDMKNVDVFAKAGKKECKEDCKMECCKDKEKKMACAEDCEKECCKKK